MTNASVRGTKPPAILLAVAFLSACASAPDPDAACTLVYTPVGGIQGSSAATPLAGDSVTTQGVVTGDFEGPAPALGGFYLQDLRDDGDAATSNGIFVANGGRNEVTIGDVVRVTGIAGEVRQQTQIEAVRVLACGRATPTPVDVTLPFQSSNWLERYEGMLVRLPQTLHVTETYQLGRYGEVVLSSGGRLPQPTNVADPGTAALAVQAANDLNRIIVDDDSYVQNPAVIFFARDGAPLSADNTLRGGDQVSGIIGVLTQTVAAGTDGRVSYRIRPIDMPHGAPRFAAANARPSTPPAVGGTLRVASFNVLNYFNSFADCTAGVRGAPTSCRGAEDVVEFDRQWRKIVAAVIAMDPHILGIIEIENDGYGPNSAIADLVDRLNAATAPGRYTFIDVDAATGTTDALGTDAIRVGFIYQPASASPVGSTAALNSVAFVNAGESQLRNRPTLAQAFEQPDGARVIAAVTHFKSKGSACDVADALDGQGNCNRARTIAARELLAWLDRDPTRTGSPNVLIIGDLNAYAREDPVMVLRRGGYVDLLDDRIGSHAYSFVFNGQWGYLDHALASRELAPRVTGAVAWHINADEPPVLDYNTNFRNAAQRSALYRADPFRSSDHDPILVGLDLAR